MMAAEVGLMPPQFWRVSLWEMTALFAGRLTVASAAHATPQQSEGDMAAILRAAGEAAHG